MLVDNTSGVLSRVAGLFSRRGYNIDSLTVGETADPRYSRMTVMASGDELILEQITKQLAKLIDVVDIKVLEEGRRAFPENSSWLRYGRMFRIGKRLLRLPMCSGEIL